MVRGRLVNYTGRIPLVSIFRCSTLLDGGECHATLERHWGDQPDWVKYGELEQLVRGSIEIHYEYVSAYRNRNWVPRTCAQEI